MHNQNALLEKNQILYILLLHLKFKRPQMLMARAEWKVTAPPQHNANTVTQVERKTNKQPRMEINSILRIFPAPPLKKNEM